MIITLLCLCIWVYLIAFHLSELSACCIITVCLWWGSEVILSWICVVLIRAERKGKGWPVWPFWVKVQRTEMHLDAVPKNNMKKKLPKLCQTSNSNSHLKSASYLLMKWATLSALWVPSASAGSFEEGFEHTKQKQSGHFMPQARFWWHLTARKAISFTIQSQTPLIAREVCCSLGNTLWYFSSLIFAVHLSLCLFPCGENWFTRVVILIWH